MRGIRTVAIMICMALMGSSTKLFAQYGTCGSGLNGSVVICCGEEVYVSAEWYPGGVMHLGQLLAKCPVDGCEGYVVFAGGSCTTASLSTPEMRKQLNQISQHMPLLVASCTSGLVPYQPVPDDEKFMLRRPKLDLKGNGE